MPPDGNVPRWVLEQQQAIDGVKNAIGRVDEKQDGLNKQFTQAFRQWDDRFMIIEDRQTRTEDAVTDLSKRQEETAKELGAQIRGMCNNCNGVKDARRNAADIVRIRKELDEKAQLERGRKAKLADKKRWYQDRNIQIWMGIMAAIGLSISIIALLVTH